MGLCIILIEASYIRDTARLVPCCSLTIRECIVDDSISNFMELLVGAFSEVLFDFSHIYLFLLTCLSSSFHLSVESASKFRLEISDVGAHTSSHDAC